MWTKWLGQNILDNNQYQLMLLNQESEYWQYFFLLFERNSSVQNITKINIAKFSNLSFMHIVKFMSIVRSTYKNSDKNIHLF